MPKLVFESLIDAPVEEVWAFHGSLEALKALTPPGQTVTILGPDTEIRDGALHRIRVGKGPFGFEWHARISEVLPPRQFVDTAEKSPFGFWRHLHAFEDHGGGKTLLRDVVEYRAPFGFLGSLVEPILIRPQIRRLFAYRHAATKRALETA